MSSPTDRPRPHRLRLQVMLVTMLSLLAFVYEIWNAYTDYTWAHAQTALISLRLKHLDGILRLDDELGVEVRGAALTGDPGAQARYFNGESQREALLTQLLQLDPTPDRRAMGLATLAALRQIGAEQRQVFKLVQSSQADEARSRLISAPLVAARTSYGQGMAAIRESVERDGDAVDETLLADLLWSGITAALTAVLLVVASLFVFRITRRWQAEILKSYRDLNAKSLELETSNHQLNAKSHELELFNHQLDEKVEERTKELRDAAVASLNMMEDAVQWRENTERARGELDFLASYDPVTGLANQSLFLERLQARLTAARSGDHLTAVLVLDLQRFNTINDAFGRGAGDALLKRIADRLVEVGGEPSRFARLDADHFAIVATDLVDVEHVGRYVDERLETAFGAQFRLGDTDLRISARVGIALYPDDGADAVTLLHNAEAALKRAKRSGDRYMFFTEAMTARVAERLSMESRLRKALDNDEFVLHYQPKINLASGLVTSAEALIRWNDPATALAPPLQFIPILEETGLIHEVGRWAMRKAIADYLRWRDAGLGAVRIAVNVSPLQLRNRHFVEEVGDALGVDSHAAAGLELEITESLIMEDVKHSKTLLLAIRAMGVSIAIDDFGTGYSSLSYLAKLPVDALKIDRAFVSEMTNGADGLALVSTIVNLAHSLKLKVVAEGVETDKQRDLLRLLGCDEMQGYLFSKPVPADVFEAKFLDPMRISAQAAMAAPDSTAPG